MSFEDFRPCFETGEPPEGTCPKCGEECWRHEVDVGVGVIYGPYGCGCGWSEDPQYDRSAGPSAADAASPGRHVDQWGNSHSLARVAEKLDHFGLDGAAIVPRVFGKPIEKASE